MMVLRIGISALALVSPFFFPYPYTLFLSFLAGLYFVPLPFVIGLMTDVLYYHPSVAPVPYGIIGGIIVTVLAHFAGRFIRARVAL